MSLLASIGVVMQFSFPLSCLDPSALSVGRSLVLPACCLVASRPCGLGVVVWGTGRILPGVLGTCLVLPGAAVDH